jgi:hypothetical protein
MILVMMEETWEHSGLFTEFLVQDPVGPFPRV